MNDNENKKVYLPIGAGRLLDIKVILDDNPNPIYEGMIEDAPEEIKRLRYSKVDMSGKITYYVYSEFNN